MSIKHPFEYQRPNDAEVKAIEGLRDGCKSLHDLILRLPASRERSLAVTKLEEVSMWVNKAVVFNGTAQ